MSQLSTLLLTAALIGAGITGAPQAQAPQGGQQAAALPDGAGKQLVQQACTNCHGVNQITNSTGYTKERWQGLFGTMVKLSDPQRDTVAQYLEMPPAERQALLEMNGVLLRARALVQRLDRR